MSVAKAGTIADTVTVPSAVGKATVKVAGEGTCGKSQEDAGAELQQVIAQ
ncbi:unnamed protein product [Ixodes pacificus]